MMVDSISDRTVGDSREQAAITRPRFKHIFWLCRSCIDCPVGCACSGFRSDLIEMEQRRSVEIKSKCIPLNRLLYPAMLDLVWQGTVSPQCRCVL